MVALIGVAGMFTVAFLASLLAVSFVWSAQQVRARRAGLGLDEAEAIPGDAVIRDEEEISTIALWGSILRRFSLLHVLQERIAEADLKWTAGRATAAMLLLAALTASIVSAIPWVPAILQGMLPVLAGGLPYLYIAHMRNRRFARFSTQFPEALDSLARALKAGLPIAAAIELLAREHPEPLAGEMRRVRDEWRLGSSWDHALDHLAERVPIPEVALFVAAVKMQNRMGGRLNDVLSRLGETMRDGAALDSEVRSISAHSRITGMVLTVMPIGIGLVMLLVNPEYMAMLFHTEIGKTVLTVAICSNVAAHFLIKKICQVRN